MMEPLSIFVCYARDDCRWVDPESPHNLIPWLQDSLRRDNVTFWFDRHLHGGDLFRTKIESAIDRSAIAILLVDQPFLSSEFIEKVELPRIMARAEREEMVVIPILTTPCLWEDNPLIQPHHLLPVLPKKITPLLSCIQQETQWAEARIQILNELIVRIRKIRSIGTAREPSPHKQDPMEIAVGRKEPPDADPPRSAQATELPPTPQRARPSWRYAKKFEHWFRMDVRAPGCAVSVLFSVLIIVAAVTIGLNRVAEAQAHAARVRELSKNSLGMKFVEIKSTGSAGFQMGAPDGDPAREPGNLRHTAILTKGFMMSVYDVTRGNFAEFVKDASYHPEGENDPQNWRKPGFEQTDDHPVVCVSWNDAQAFCKWLNKKENRHYRLPTEAEWEYACRAGATMDYFWGDDPSIMGDYAWFAGNAPSGTRPVGQKKPNNWGLYDMSGNTWQRCEDGYGDYPAGPVTDPEGDETAAERVSRGGAWGNPAAPHLYCAHRGRDAADYRSSNLGFRICVDF